MLRGVPATSVSVLNDCWRSWFQRGPAPSSFEESVLVDVAPVGPDEFREAGEIVWDPFLCVEPSQDRVQAAGYRWMAEVRRTVPVRARLWLDRTARGSVLGDLWENFLRLVSAYAVLAEGGLLVHGAAAGFPGEGILFPGPSGAGKSTISGILEREGVQILSDDCTAIVRSDNGYGVAGLPFGGERRPRRPPTRPFPLRTICLLEKAHETATRPARQSETLARLVASSPFVNGDPAVHSALLEHATAIVGAVRTVHLRFSRSGGVARALQAR